jgi:hypothetical protein
MVVVVVVDVVEEEDGAVVEDILAAEEEEVVIAGNPCSFDKLYLPSFQFSPRTVARINISTGQVILDVVRRNRYFVAVTQLADRSSSMPRVIDAPYTHSAIDVKVEGLS